MKPISFKQVEDIFNSTFLGLIQLNLSSNELKIYLINLTVNPSSNELTLSLVHLKIGTKNTY